MQVVFKFLDYDLLIELIGGSDGIAKEIVIDALKKKKKCNYSKQSSNF